LINDRKKSSDESLNSINTILLELKKSIKAEETIVFCGAGISFNSGLPLANDLVRYVLEKLTVSREEIETIINSNLPFESFIETLYNNSKIDRIFDIFDLGEPNTNHFLLAKLAKAKYLKTICTTNFDQLIEKAMEREGLVRGKDFQVFYQENDLDHIDWDDDKIHLIKIHGSVEDKKNMAITLQQVAKKVLSQKRMGVIEHIFSKGAHNNVLILGYSCSDVFDISPQIEAIRENHKKVIYIDHNEEEEELIKDIADKKQKNPFKHFSGSKRVVYKTNKLVKELWDYYLPEVDFPRTTIANILWKKCVDDWFLETEEKYTEGAKYAIAGIIFDKISEYESTVVFYEQALSIARDIGDKQNEGKWLGNLGIAYDSFGDYQKAIEFHEQALSIARDIGDKHGEGSRLGNLGAVYFSLGDYQKTIEFYEQALSIARDIGDKQNEGSWLGNLGIAYYSLGDYHKATEFYEQALSIARDIGDKQNEGKWLGNLGIAYYSLGDYHKAIEFHEQTLSITRDIGDKYGEGRGLGNLGAVYFSLGDYQKAIEFYEQALSIARDIGDKYSEGGELGNLGTVYKNLGDYHKAIEFYEQALRISRDIGDKKNEGSWFGNLGNAYVSLGDYHKATEFYEQALRISRDIGDKKNEGIWLSNLGIAYENLGDYHKAIEFHGQALVIFKPMLGDDHPYVKLVERNLNIAKSQQK